MAPLTGAGHNIGDASGATLTQVNILDNTAALGIGQRTYYYTEFNVMGQSANVGSLASFVNSEVNISTGGVVGFSYTYDVNTTLNMTGGSTGTLQTLNGITNISGGSLGGNTDNNGVLNLSGTGYIFTQFDSNSGSTVNMTGGTIDGNAIFHNGSTLIMSGGEIKNGATFAGEANISGGTFGYFYEVDGVFNMNGGSMLGYLDVNDGATANINGGNIGIRSEVFGGGTMNISGGSFGSGLNVYENGTLNFFGTSFLLDGNAIAGLNSIGDTVTITARDMQLTGLLADGSAFDYDLIDEANSVAVDYADLNATITVTLVPEPGSLALLGLGGLAMVRRRR